MTEAGMPDMVKKPDSGFDIWDPLNVASIVVWLGSAQSAQSQAAALKPWAEKSRCRWLAHRQDHHKGARWEPAELGAGRCVA